MNETPKQRKFLFVVSTRYERDAVGKAIRLQREMQALMQRNPEYKPSERRVTFTWKDISRIKPGEQDIVFAGGREEDEDLVKALKGTGQLIVRYSQLEDRTPYSGRSVEELGYSFLMRKDHRILYDLIDPVEELVNALTTRDPQKLSSCMANSRIYATGYLEECCKIPVAETPEELINQAFAKEDEEIRSLNKSKAYWSRGTSTGYAGSGLPGWFTGRLY